MGWQKWFRYNTSLEKKLFLFVAVLSAVVFVLFVCLLSTAHDPGVCNSPECVRAAASILDSVDPTVDPCDDFYKFACGTFLKNAFSKGQATPLNSLKTLVKNKLKEIVIETANERNMSRMLAMQRKFYRACMNDKDIEEDQNRTFLKLLDDLVGGWPVVKSYNWVQKDFEWTKAMVKARRLGFYYEFYFRIEIYYKDNNSLWIRPPSRTDISSFYWKDQNIKLLSGIASDLGAQSVDTPTHLRSAIYFAEQLDLIVEKHEKATADRQSNEMKRVAVKNLDHTFIKIDWYNFLTNITGLRLKGDDVVIFDVEDYFRDLYYLLMKTQKKTQANYIAWAVISTNIDYLTKNIREKYAEIKKSSNNTNMDASRSDTCFKISTGLFQNVAEGEYIRRYTSPEKRKQIKEMIKNIKQQFATFLHTNTWMDKETRDYAIQHLKNITEAIGWTDIVYNAEKFERAFGYHQVKFTSYKLPDMARRLAQHGVNRYYKQILLTLKDNADEYLNTPELEVNAYYLRYFNKLLLPTPILQGLIFDEKRPQYMNYGALGSIIGHEITHGFTESGIDDCSDNETWWTNKTMENFKNTSQCLIDKYDNYPGHLDEYNKNGTVTLEENIADFTGMNLAYTAYQNWVKHNKYEKNLPGVKFTANQIFWIMASTYLCYEPKLREKDSNRKNSTHAVPSFRVIGPIRNSPYFAKDFDCPVGSKMNPRKKCRIFV